jgi:hypothetical protein
MTTPREAASSLLSKADVIKVDGVPYDIDLNGLSEDITGDDENPVVLEFSDPINGNICLVFYADEAKDLRVDGHKITIRDYAIECFVLTPATL